MCSSDLSGSAIENPDPAARLSQIISEEARVYISPTVLRLIVKYRWAELAKAAHEIHGSAT